MPDESFEDKEKSRSSAYTEMMDGELEALWVNHMDGGDAPAYFSARMSDDGPEILFSHPPATYRWRRSRNLERGRYWHRTFILG